MSRKTKRRTEKNEDIMHANYYEAARVKMVNDPRFMRSIFDLRYDWEVSYFSSWCHLDCREVADSPHYEGFCLDCIENMIRFFGEYRDLNKRKKKRRIVKI